MANWKKSQNYKLKKKIENNKKKQVEDIANGKEPREFKMPKTRRSTAADALDSYIARRAAREQIYGSETPKVMGSTRTPGDIMSEAVDRLRDRISMNKNGVGTSPVTFGNIMDGAMDRMRNRPSMANGAESVPTVPRNSNNGPMTVSRNGQNNTQNRIPRVQNYVGNVDINNRPIVELGNGQYATTETTFQERWKGDEENGHYEIGHFATITKDGRKISDEEMNEYIDRVMSSDNPFETDKKGLNLLYKIDDKLTNGEYIRDNNLEQAFKEADDWDVEMHNLQDSMYKDQREKNNLSSVSRDLVNRVARNADNSRAELDRKAAMIESGAFQRQQLLKELDAKASAEEMKRMDLQRQAEAERQKRGIDQNKLSAAALEQIKNMRNGDGTTLSGTVPEYTPVQQDEYRNTKEYQWARRHPEAASAVSVFTNPITGIEGLVNTGRQFVNPEKMDPNQLKGAYFQSALREGITRGKKDDLSKDSLGRRIGFKDDGRNSFAENVSDFLVNTGIDAINSTAGNLMMGPVNIAAMSGNAAQSKLYDALQDKDTSRNQALATSAAFGIAEALFEKVSFENLMKWNLNPKTLGDFAKNVVRSVVAEGSEEVNTDIANDISDIFINRDNSEAGRIYNDYLLRGADPRQAFVYTLGDRIKNYGLSFLGGGLSGGASAIGGAMYGAYQNRQQQRYNDALEAYKKARTNAYLEQGQSLGQALAEADINVWDDAAKAGVGFYLDEGEETNGNYVFELDNNENIVSDEVSGTVEESSTVKQDTDDLVNAAVDELIRQQQEETDTSESTPDEAKAQTETMINALNEQQAETENAEIDNITPKIDENLQNNTLNAENRTREEPEPDTGMSRTDVSREKIAEDLTKDNLSEPKESGNRFGVDTSIYDKVVENVKNGGTINQDGLFDKLAKSADIKKVHDYYNDDQTPDFAIRNRFEDDLRKEIEREAGRTDNVNNADSNDLTKENVTKSQKSNDKTKNGNKNISASGLLQTADDVNRELDRRAEMRFPGDDDIKKAYKILFTDFVDGIKSDADMYSMVFAYDENVAKAYSAGLNGDPISSLDNDKAFINFDKQFHDIVDIIYENGLARRGAVNSVEKAEAEKIAEETKSPERETNKTKRETEKVSGAESAPASSPQLAIADKVSGMIAAGKDFSSGWLFDVADKAYGGTQAEGTYTVKDAYDGMELGINKYLMSADFIKNGNTSLEKAEQTLTNIQDMLKHIPTQTKRTAEMEQFQQFSTPANLAYTAAWLANINENDTVLEPSAGIGGLALFGKAWGAKVYANELSERRLAFLNELGLDETFNENAEHINDILPDYVKPTVVLMNPPFSSTAGRTSKNSTANAKKHIEQALDRLSDNGRLVAIVGKGMSDDAPSFRAWFNDLRKEYDIKANVRIDGSNFKKNGTTFDDQLIIVDKTGPQEGKTLTGEYKDLADVLTDLEGIRNERIISTTDTELGVPLPISSGNTGLSDGSIRSGEVTGDSNRGNNAADGRGTDTTVERRDEQSGQQLGRSDSEGSSEGSTETERDRDVSTRQRGSRGRDTGRVAGTDGQNNESGSDESGGLQLVSVENKKKEINIESTYTNYAPSKVNIKGAKPHPGVLVESAAMGAVEPPEATYVPHLPQELIESGKPSAAQLENIVYAGQAHQIILPNGTRKGYFIGDGTGVGKGVQLASIILDNFNQGRKKAIWVSEKTNLMLDAQRDWGDLGQDPKDVFDFQKATAKGKDIPDKDGILFAAYSTLGSRKQAGIDQIKKWVGEDFDGVIVLDEAHNMKSAVPIKGKRGTKKPAEQALWGIELQKQLPKARVVYATATGASDISQYAYLERLGLWGPGTGFDSFQDFASSISSGGLAAMELVARDMKSMGDYMARSISYDGVQYETITHPLNEVQTDIYNKMSEGWRTVLRNVEKAIEITGADSNARKNARGRFWSTLQNFYNQILTSMSLPSVIADMENELKNGRSIVIQIVNTNASQTDKKLSAMKDGDLENLDLTPSEALIDYLRNAFPVQAFEEYEDEDGRKRTRPVKDSKGNPVNDKRAVALRDQLIEDIGKMQVPDGPLEMILDHFGVDNVAEVTGRGRRVVYKKQSNGRMKRVTESWSKAKGEADANAFQDGKKRILIFSEAGGTGKSYHADLRAKNQQQRVHYILQPGWKADAAIQGLGRTHRTNEASQPIYKLVTTDVMGQKRFTSTIAKRLNQMGALTKGQRDAGSGIFSEKDNLETPLAADALEAYYRQAPKELVKSLGVNIYDEYGRINDSAEALRDVSKFLNRILALDIKDQNEEFEKFYKILEDKTEQAIKNGTLDRGLETIKADKIETIDEKEVYKDKNSSTATKYVQLKVSNKPELISYDDIMDRPVISMVRLQDGSVRAVFEGANKTDPRTGRVVKTFDLRSPIRGVFNRYSEKTLDERTTPIPKNEWKKAWEEETDRAPEYIDNTVHMLTGTLLPIWKQLPQNNTRVMRIVTNDGNQYLGRIIDAQNIDSVLKGLGAERTKENYTSKDVMKQILNDNQEVNLTFDKQRLKRSRVANDYRIEVLGNNLWSLPKYYDVFSEKINGKERYFVPTGERGEKALEKLFSANAVRDIVPAGTSDEDILYAKNKKKGDSNNSETPTINPGSENPRGDYDIDKRPQKKPTTREQEQKKRAKAFQESLRPDKFIAKKNIGSDAKTERLEDILGQAAYDFGFQYTPGKRYTKGEDIGGQFNRRNKGIRTKVANYLPDFSHEFGHWLADHYDISSATIYDPAMIAEAQKAFYEEYEEGDYGENEVFDEGIAEFVRLYLQNRDTARIDYPELSENILNKLTPRDLDLFENLADKINAVYAAGAKEITQHTVKHEESLRDYREFGKKVHDAMVREQINWVDSNYGMKDFDYEYGTNTHMRATNAEYIDGTIGYAMDGQLRDLEGNYLGLSLKDCVKGVNLDPKSQEFRDFGDYLVVRHAPERLALGMRTYEDDRQNNQKWMAERQSELDKKYPHFKMAAENLDTFQKNVLKNYALKYGLITPQAYKNMLKDYPHYVPFFRTGFKEKGNALRRAHGSGRTIINPLDNIITSTMKIMNAASRNAVLLEMRKAALENDANALFLEQIPEPKVPMNFDMRGIKEELHNKIADIDIARGVDPTAQDLLHDMIDKIDNTLTQFQTGRARKDLNEISIMVNGKPEFWKVNDENLFRSLTSMDYRTSNTLVQLYGKLTRFMTSNTTGNNVVWSIFSNSPRDFQTLINYSDTKNVFKLAKLIGDSYIQSFNEFRGAPTSDYYSEFLSMGAKGAPVWVGSDTYVKDMRKLVNSSKKFDPSMLNPFKYFRFLAETIEMGPRYATYRLMRERGMSPQRAFYESMDITTNFRKKGLHGKEFNKAVQFFNANVQGLDHAARYYSAEDIKGKPKEVRDKAIRARMTFLVATSLITAMLSYAWNHRDDDDKKEYNLLSNYIKNYYFTYHIGDGKFFAIPKNHELSVLESFFERSFEYLADQNDQAFKEYFDYFAEQVTPPIASEILEFPVHAGKNGLQQAMDDAILGVISNTGVYGIMAQTAMNKNYLGAKIVPAAYENLAPKRQYNKKTSEAAYLIGQALNISPMKLDHFAGNVLGYIWDYQSALFPINAGNVKGERDPYLGVTKKYVRDNRYSNDVSGWIYDKARESKMRYETEGDNLLEASMDEYMKNRYNTYNKLSKDEEETKKSRDTRSDVLQELIDYRKGRMPGDFKTVSSLVEETGDHNYLPSVMDKTYKNGKGGEEIKFTSEEYIQLQNIYEDLYLTYMNESIDENESVEKWEYTKTKAKDEARYRALDELLRQKGIEPKTTKPKTSPGKFDAYVDAEFKKKKK